jgi:hypothetical protein
MKELLLKGVIKKAHFPLYLSSWSDKASLQCMYISTQVKTWSLPHLKGGCWYLDCAKGYRPAEEETEKSANDALDSTGLGSGSGTVGGAEDDHDEEDLSLFSEKEKNKVLAKRKEADRATLKKEKEVAREKEKTKRVAEKAKKVQDKSAKKVAGKSLSTPEGISITSPSS